MSRLTVAVIGAGAAGTSAAETLHASPADVEVELFARNGERPHNRTLVNKGVAIGLLDPDQIALPDTGTSASMDTVRGIDPRTRRVQLDSGASRAFDALIIATGSRPRLLDDVVAGRDQALGAGRLTTLHSFVDAVRVRDLLDTTRHARVLILGGGLIASETASLLAEAGHDTTLIARSHVPGASAVGVEIAQRLLSLHQASHATYLGRTPAVIRTRPNRITIILSDGTHIHGDLAIVAYGTIPAAPAPWTGPDGIPVDGRMRTIGGPGTRIYAAGGVALHHYPGRSSYRIDHWEDAAAQGTHAANALLHDLGRGDDPGIYLPSSPFSARIHGHTLSGFGHPALGTSTRVVSTDPLLVAHHLDDIPVALTGVDAVGLARDWAPRLHQPLALHR